MTDPTFVFVVGLDFTGADRNLLRQLAKSERLAGSPLDTSAPAKTTSR